MIDDKQLQEWRKLAEKESYQMSDMIDLSDAALPLLDEVERLTVARAEMSLSLAGALRRIRELEGMLETERTTDDTDNGYDESEV